MARNDTILLDGIVEQRIFDSHPSNRMDEVFEYLGFEQILKDYDLSREEIDSGWVDGGDDGGIDGFFTFVNGHLLRDAKSFSWPKRHAEIDVWVITSKHHDTFKQQTLNSMYASVSELFDLSLQRVDFRGVYSDPLVKCRELFLYAFRKLAAERPQLTIRYAYISRGDTTAIGENVSARGNQIVELTHSLFSSSTSTFTFCGAAELVTLYRRTRKFSITLPVQEYLSQRDSGYVALARLSDYARFVTDDDGGLRRYLFDSNVRDFLGGSQVNDDILESLRDLSGPDFWWLNNGVTILATGATVVGKGIQLEDVQIVNGLQTTETVYRFYESGSGTSTDTRLLLVKMIISREMEHRDQIIRATNNQNIVETAGLRATDKIQRDIEEHLDRFGWYYERRKNYFRNIGKPPKRFVTPMYLAAGFVALIMKNPARAASLKAKFMRNDDSYSAVFSERMPLNAWVVITEVLKRVEAQLDLLRPHRGVGERFLATWRNLVAFIAVSRIFRKFSYSVHEFASCVADNVTSEVISEIWNLIDEELVRLSVSKPGAKSRAKSVGFVLDVCKQAATRFGIDGSSTIGQRELSPDKSKSRRSSKSKKVPEVQRAFDDSFLSLVDSELPEQPWKPGMHRLVATKLGCKASDVFAATSLLVERGVRNKQVDGIVYDANGVVIAMDLDRHREPPAAG